jgi:hypothetical protein
MRSHELAKILLKHNTAKWFAALIFQRAMLVLTAGFLVIWLR